MLESELFALFERTTDAAFSVNQEGGICSWNKAAEKLFGYTAPEALRRTCYELFEGLGPLGTPVCQTQTCIGGCAGKDVGTPNFDMSAKTRSGQRVWINISTVVFDNPRTGRRLLVHLAHDITDQKRTEELVHKMLDLSRELTGVGESAVRAAPVPSLGDASVEIIRRGKGLCGGGAPARDHSSDIAEPSASHQSEVANS